MGSLFLVVGCYCRVSLVCKLRRAGPRQCRTGILRHGLKAVLRICNRRVAEASSGAYGGARRFRFTDSPNDDWHVLELAFIRVSVLVVRLFWLLRAECGPLLLECRARAVVAGVAAHPATAGAGRLQKAAYASRLLPGREFVNIVAVVTAAFGFQAGTVMAAQGALAGFHELLQAAGTRVGPACRGRRAVKAGM